MPSSEQLPILEIVTLPAGASPWPTRDPFLFCVHHHDAYPAGTESFGPATSLTGRNLGHDFAGVDGWRMYHGREVPGFPGHPHRGFETVTIVRQGLVDHADSMGAAARYGRGDVQWLTAGRGIQHSEMFPLINSEAPNPTELFQIWLNLPGQNKMAAPHFSMLWNDAIPSLSVRDTADLEVDIRVIAGPHADHMPPPPPPKSWAAEPEHDVAIWTLKLAPRSCYTLPPARPGTHRSLYFFNGATVAIGGIEISSGHEIRLRPDHEVPLQAGSETAELLLLQGQPIGEPVAHHGPFVMNTRDELRQAIRDYQQTRFGGWPWDRDDPVHGPEDRRFARYPDGRQDAPGD